MNTLKKLIDQTSALFEETSFIINNDSSHFLSRPLPSVGPLREPVISDVNFSLQFEIQSIQKKGWNNGLFCVILLFVMVMSDVFPFYLLLRPLQNMQCFWLSSFWKKIQVKSISNDVATETELIKTETDLNWAEWISFCFRCNYLQVLELQDYIFL